MAGSPPIILTIANAKGGVGKSTLTYHLACCFSQQFGDQVGVVDYDNQQSIQGLVNNYETLRDVPFDLINSQKLGKVDKLLTRTDLDLVLVDTPPVLVSGVREILDITNVLIIPITPSSRDEQSFGTSVGVYKRAKDMNPNMMVRIVLNRVKGRSLKSREIRREISNNEALSWLKVMDTELKDRVIHQTFDDEFNTLWESKDRKAQREVEQLAKEILADAQGASNGKA